MRNCVRGGGAVHAAHDGVGRLAVDRGLIERRGLIDALKVEADDLLRLAIFLDLEVVGGEAADNLSRLLVADNDVGEDQVAVDLEGVGALRIRLRLGSGPAQRPATRPIPPSPARAMEVNLRK